VTKKQTNDWTDHLGDSSLPADDFTFTDGSNYGLDGFDFVTPANEGVEQAARLPEARGISGLPDGIVTGDNEDCDEDFFMEEASEGGEGLYLAGVLDDGAMPDTENDHAGTLLGSMFSEEEGALPLTAAQKQAASLADLKWIDPTQEQDPDRLPKDLLPDRPPLDSSPELEEAWGVDRRTDGISIIPNVTDLEVALYDQSIKEGPESGLPQPSAKTAQEVKDSILWAIRQSHYGTDLTAIKRGLIQQLGHDARRTVKAMEIIEQEHGLVGNVFVRANAFPGLKNGKWAKELRKIAKTAHYVITDDKTIGKKLGMAVVSEVPWKKALGYYREWLGIAGYKLASKGDPQTILRSAFLRGPEDKVHETSLKPIVKPVVASQAQAAQEMQAVKPVPKKVQGAEDKAVDRKRRSALIQIAKWAKEGLLSQDEAIQIKDSGGTPDVMIKSASRLMQSRQSDGAGYDGTGVGAADAQKDRTPEKKASMDERQAELFKRAKGKLQRYLTRSLKAGLLTKDEVQRIWNIDKSPADLMRIATSAVQVASEHRQDTPEALEQADYKGAGSVASLDGNSQRDQMANLVDNRPEDMRRAALVRLTKMIKGGHLTKAEAEGIRTSNMSPTEMVNSAEKLVRGRHAAKKVAYEGQIVAAAPQSRPAPKVLDDRLGRIASIAKKTGQQASEIQGVLNWSRRLMSEGVAGDELDQTLTARFSPPLLEAVAPLLKEAREVHEGLSGFLYVDADAYASPTGVKGCKKGALKHRTNGLKFVMAMGRCASCTQANVDGYCQKYNKMLVDAAPVKDVKAYQKRSIKMANASDQEVTASLFSPSEFSLQSNLDGEMILDEDASAEMLSDILFGGTEL